MVVLHSFFLIINTSLALDEIQLVLMKKKSEDQLGL